MPVLYGAPLSPFVRKVAVLLEEKGVAYEWKPVRPRDRDEAFSRISPLGKIPAYQDDRAALADSSVICVYLEKTHPAPPFYPEDALALAQALWFEEYFDSGLIAPMRTVYVQCWMNPQFLGKPTDQAQVADAWEVQLPPMFAYLEAQLRPKRWMVGEAFSIADISLAVGFMNLRLAGYALDAQRYPKLAAYIKRALARPSFMKCEVFYASIHRADA